ncbi:hypothetical protein BFW38_13670 [Terasakiispira papahanaumokuakeensis]|uniref:Type IV secretion protein Rhs n=2 Tax=Terasakiispira papahanaumokuakeensis TaxID=197479 RepID=A0A1E2VCP4_9GAMM|nr:hypothetical protein BFW38_13670 [Terasakiispira papahanaumokuakeensis]
MNLPMPALPTGGASPLALNAPEIIEGLADRCSSCEPSVGNPVNPMLGVKLLPAETDFALPAPRPFSFSRGYLSSNARVGSLGQGWSIPGEGSFITLSQTACELHDAQGRVITFSALGAGEERYSQTEQLWIRRGLALQGDRISLSPRWVAVSDRLQQDADVIAVTDGTLCYLFTRPAEPEGRPSSSPWRLTAECDRNGYTTTYHWHEDRLSRVTDSAGRDYTFHYASVTEAGDGDTGDRLVGVQLVETSQMALTEPHLGQDEPEIGRWLVRYDYSSAGDLRAVHHRDERLAREFEWRQHILVAHRVPGGVAMRYEWDQYTPEGRVTAQHEAQGLSRHFQYLAHQTLVTDSLGREERYHFAGEGVGQRWVAHTRADGSQLRFHYDRAGRRIATVDPLGRETRLERDEKGQLIAQVMPGGERWTIERNAQGLPVGMTGPEQTRWTIQRNERGNPVSVTGPNGTTTHDYDDPALPDRPTTITDPSGARRHFVWNSRGQLQVETDCSHHATRYDYDADDQLEAVTNALGETHRMSHDVMGRRLNHELPDGALWQQHYDRQGRASSLEDPLGGLQQIEYDAAGRPIAQTYTDGSRQEVLYDQAGRITELVLGNGARYRFSYDAMDRVIREENPDGRDQRFEYDAAGQLIARTEMNRLGPDEQPLTTRYTYDANGRLIERHLPETEQAPALCEVFAWRADGHLSRAHNAHSDVLFHYDDAGRLAGEQQRHCVRAAQADAITENEDWSWQAQHRFTETGAPATSQWGALPECAWLTYGSGHLLGLNVPALGLDLTFEPDALHRETQRQFSVDHQAASQSSLPQSSAPQPLVPQRLVLERGYTTTGQVTHLATQGVLNGLHQHFDYDALGRMTHRETGAPHSNNAQRIDYIFDEAGRLIGSQHGPQTHHYPMDAAGNRLAPLDDGMTASSSHNQIHHLDGVDYRYDGAGNLIERCQPHGERLTMGYDAANRLVHLRRIDTHGQTLEVDYHYDPLGRRTQKIVTEADGTTGTTHYGWDGDHLVHEDLPGPISTTVIYEPGGFVPMLRIDHDGDDTRTSAYVTDALGTPMQLLDPDGTVRWQAQPDDWAAVHNETGDTRQPIRFQGQWHDEESGLYYNRHRYYDPQQGRYITQDPIGLKGGTNLYGYVGDPTSAIDPLGLTGRLIVGVAEEAICYSVNDLNEASIEQIDAIERHWNAARTELKMRREESCQKQRDTLLGFNSGLTEEEISASFNQCMNDAASADNVQAIADMENIMKLRQNNPLDGSEVSMIKTYCSLMSVPDSFKRPAR